MDEVPDVYYLESLAQLRATADDTRQRILEPLVDRSMTVTQVADRLGMAPARVHYHVRELERVGLVRLVETREKGGILEKYYRSVARNFLVPSGLLRAASLDETTATFNGILQNVTSAFVRALTDSVEHGAQGTRGFSIERTHLWLTLDEFRTLTQQVVELLAPYEKPRGVEGERETTAVFLAHPTAPADDDREDGMT